MMRALLQRVSTKAALLRMLLRLTPFDTTTVAGRANERHRRIGLTALASALAKIISVLTALISVPLTLHYLGTERYGMWMTISSLTAFLAFADLGIGNGMLNAISAAHGRDDRIAIRSFVSSGFFALSLVTIGLLCLFATAYDSVPWASLFNVHSDVARQEVGPAVAIFFVCFALAIPAAIVQRVQMALQRGFLSSLWQCLSSIFGLIGVLVAIYYEAGLPWLVLAYVGAPLLVSVVNGIVFFGYMHPEISPACDNVSRGAAIQLLRTGVLFLVLQLVAAVSYASDSFVIAQLMGASAVVDYVVPERMFSLITMVLAMVLAPLWPAYGEAIARGDVAWVRRTLRRSVTIALTLSFLFSTTLSLFAPWLIELWVGKAVVPSMALLAGLAVWKTLEAGGSALAVFLNGAHVVRLQVIMAVLTAICSLVLKIYLVQSIGIAGGVWANIFSYTFFTLIPVIFLLPGILDQLHLSVESRRLKN